MKGGAESVSVAELDKMPMISKKHKGRIIEDLSGKDIPKCCGKCVNFRMDDPLHNIGHCFVNGMERFSDEPNDKCTYFNKEVSDGNQN